MTDSAEELGPQGKRQRLKAIPANKTKTADQMVNLPATLGYGGTSAMRYKGVGRTLPTNSEKKGPKVDLAVEALALEKFSMRMIRTTIERGKKIQAPATHLIKQIEMRSRLES